MDRSKLNKIPLKWTSNKIDPLSVCHEFVSHFTWRKMLDIVNWGITIAIIKLDDISIREKKVERIENEIANLFHFQGLRLGVLLGSAGTCLGSWIKVSTLLLL